MLSVVATSRNDDHSGDLLQRMERFVDSSSILVIASHSAGVIRRWYNKAVLLERGEVVVIGGVDDVLKAYRN